jgi:small subunit ribosomal protein S17
MARTKKTGIEVTAPEKTCDDANCPFHGTLKIRGNEFIGRVASTKMQRSAVVEWSGWRYIPKFERYKRTKTRITVHNPPCIPAQEGDVVKVAECRPLSKTKNFVMLQIIGRSEKYALEKEALEEGKHKEKAKVEKGKAAAEKEEEKKASEKKQ